MKVPIQWGDENCFLDSLLYLSRQLAFVFWHALHRFMFIKLVGVGTYKMDAYNRLGKTDNIIGYRMQTSSRRNKSGVGLDKKFSSKA